jgi:outer membrane protein TolC
MSHKLIAFSLLFVSGFHFASAQEEVTLEQVVALALEKNYDVRIARNVAESAETNDNYVVGAFLPQINAEAATVWNDNEQNLRFQDATRNNSGDAKSNNITGSVQAVWTLFDGTRMFATRERISQIVEQSELQVKEQMVNTIASVINNYYDIVRQKQQLEAVREQMSVSEERVKLAEKKLQVGTGIKPELLQARVDYNAQRTQVLQQEAIIAQLKEQLNNFVGLQLPTVYDVADTIIIDLNLRLDESFQNLDNTNYSLLATRKNLNIANLTLRERRAEYLPFINFNAAYNFSRNDNTKQINPFGPVYNRTEGFNYGFSMSLPILSGLNTRRQAQLARIEVVRQELLYDQQRNTINVDLRNAFTNYENAKKILLIEEENIGLAKENVFIALEAFKRGVNTFIELRTAQQSLAEAYNRLISARFNAKVAETELLRLNGSLLQ